MAFVLALLTAGMLVFTYRLVTVRIMARSPSAQIRRKPH